MKLGNAEYIIHEDSRELFIDGKRWMSDDPVEIQTHGPIEKEFFGSVLYVGLGIGLMFEIARKNKNIKQESVLEINKNVIELIGVPKNVILYEGDAWKWEPPEGASFDFVWLDVTWEPRKNNERELLSKRFAKWAKEKVYCWPNGEVVEEGIHGKF